MSLGARATMRLSDVPEKTDRLFEGVYSGRVAIQSLKLQKWRRGGGES